MTRNARRRWRIRCNRALRAYRAAGNLGRWRTGPSRVVSTRLHVHAVVLDPPERSGDPILRALDKQERITARRFVRAWSRS